MADAPDALVELLAATEPYDNDVMLSAMTVVYVGGALKYQGGLRIGVVQEDAPPSDAIHKAQVLHMPSRSRDDLGLTV